MGSNHGNLFNGLLTLARGIYGVLHTNVNGMRLGVGDVNEDMSMVGRHGQYRTGEEGRERGRHVGEGGNQEERLGVDKKSPLIVNV